MTRVPAGAPDLVAATVTGGVPIGRSRYQYRHTATGSDDAFDDRFPTQPIAVGRYQVGLVLDDRHRRAVDATSPRMPPAYRQPPPPRHHHAASAGGVSHRVPARTAARSTRLTILIAMAVVIAAVIGALGYQTWASSSYSATPDAGVRSVPATSPATPAPQADDGPRRPPPPRGDGRPGDRRGALGEADGAVPDGVTVFDDEIPAVANLDPDLLGAIRQAATDAADDGVKFYLTSGWRSAEYQNQLLREAISEYGSEREAARWVATADTSLHVSGDAIDIGPTDATAWLSKHGADYGLCQIYRNEPWHYELLPDAVDDGCTPMYADPTHDPRMQQ
jgi:D-alanyl-D-alanine carboxypeptidase